MPEKMWTSLLIMTFLKSTDTSQVEKRCYQSSNQSGSALRFAESIQQLPVYQYRYNRNHQCITKIQEFEHLFLLIGDYAKVGFAHFNVMTRDGYAQNTWYRNLGEKEGTPMPQVIEYMHM